MIPRIDITTVDVEATYDELLDIFRASMYTRIPVYENENGQYYWYYQCKGSSACPRQKIF